MNTTLLNIIHEAPFGLLFVNYSALVGVSSALAIFWVMFNFNKSRGEINFMPLLLSFVTIIGAIVNVFAEVKQQGRIIYGYIDGWENAGTSVIKYGMISLVIFAIVLLILLMPSKIDEMKDKAYKIILLVSGMFLNFYTGIFLTNEKGIALWNNPSSAIVIAISTMAVGALAYAHFNRDDKKEYFISSFAGLWLLIFFIAFAFIYQKMGDNFSNIAISNSFELASKGYGDIIGLVAVSFLASLFYFWNKNVFVSAILAFVGAYFSRYLLVALGQGVQGNELVVYHIESIEYLYTFSSISIMVGVYYAFIYAFEFCMKDRYDALKGAK